LRGVESCTEYTAKFSILLTNAKVNNKSIYLIALDCKDAFGSVAHKILEWNLRKLGVHGSMVDLIMDSYRVLVLEYRIQELHQISSQF
jgi:hypothetical protein